MRYLILKIQAYQDGTWSECHCSKDPSSTLNIVNVFNDLSGRIKLGEHFKKIEWQVVHPITEQIIHQNHNNPTNEELLGVWDNF